MLAVVKMPHMKIEGNIPENFLNIVKEYFGPDVVCVHREEDDEVIEANDSPWFRKMMKSMTPGEHMRNYRENRGITQAALGQILGGIARQDISKMERGKRAISKTTAKKLAEVFSTSVDRFI